MKSIEDIKISITDIMKKYLDKKITDEVFLSKLERMMGDKYWIRFYEGDPMATTIGNIKSDFTLQHIPNYNFQFLIERMTHSIINNSLKVYKSCTTKD